MNLEAILRAIDDLPPGELARVQMRLEERNRDMKQRPDNDVEVRIAGLREALAEFREGLTEEELNDIVWAMNIEYMGPKELADLDSIDAAIEAMTEEDN